MKSFIYIITEITKRRKKSCKIGMSSDPEVRVKTLSSGTPNGLYVYYKRKVGTEFETRTAERSIHVQLKDKSLGREWFSVYPEQAEEVVIKHLDWMASTKAKRRGSFYG